MSINFGRPITISQRQGSFSGREVGITHPDVPGYFRIADNGDIHIMADDSLGIIISASKQAIFLVGDVVKFLTKEDEGLKWNTLAFNHKATKFSEPALLISREPNSSIYDGVEDYLS